MITNISIFIIHSDLNKKNVTSDNECGHNFYGLYLLGSGVDECRSRTKSTSRFSLLSSFVQKIVRTTNKKQHVFWSEDFFPNQTIFRIMHKKTETYAGANTK